MARLTDRMATRVVDNHRRVLETSILAVAAVWHLVNDLPMMLAHQEDYGSFTLVTLVWAALAAIICGAGWRLFASPAPPRGALPTAMAVLALGAVVVAQCPPDRLVSMANWAFGVVGWVTLLVMVREERNTITVILLGPLATLAAMIRHGASDQLAAFLIAGYGVCALQIALAAGARLIRTYAELGMDQARIAAEREVERRCAEEAAEDRARRYLAIRPSTESLLAGLADGRLLPGRSEVRDRCAMEAATLRRLCLAGNDLLDPLLQDLHELADDGRRRDIRVELHATGEIGEIPPAARAALVEVARIGSDRARGVVWLTVLATATDVRLGGTADGPLPRDPLPSSGPVHVECGGGDDQCWWEATWNRRSESS